MSGNWEGTNLVRSHMGMTRDDGRPKDDFYETPEEATITLLNIIDFDGPIWEPACGKGAISQILESDYSVMSTDLHNHGYGISNIDFLVHKMPTFRFRDIITNPPYSLAMEFAWKGVEHITKTHGKLALLCRLAWLESLKRMPLFTSTPLEQVIIFSRRLPMMHRPNHKGKKVTSMMPFAWYVWNDNYNGYPFLRWADWQEYI